MKKSELKNGMIVQTEHNRFGVVEIDKNRIDFCYDPGVFDEYKNLERISLDYLFEYENNKLGIGFILDKETKEKNKDFYEEFEIGDLIIIYDIVAIYELKKIYDNGIGIFPPLNLN